ncbi:MAG: hypothetical protein ACOYL3_03505 [Desulfuromonadaceae bacterium]
MKRISLLCVILSFGLYGCGEDVSSVGSTSVFETGTISYSTVITSNPIGATVTVAPNAEYTTADATATITSTAFPGTLTKSDFTIRNISVTYTKTGADSFVMRRYLATTPLISGGSVSIPVVLARADIKDELVDSHGFIPGGISRWSFYANIDYDVIEDISGRSKHYSVQLGTINFL